MPGDVIQLASNIEHWQLRRPSSHRRGRVAAIIFAEEIATGYALAIPIDLMLDLIESEGLEEVPSCGENASRP